MAEKSRILIADDNEPNVELLEAYLSEQPCEIAVALGELGDIERAVSAGCDDFLSKPVNKLELVASWLGLAVLTVVGAVGALAARLRRS